MMSKDEYPSCETCGIPLMINHIFTEYQKFKPHHSQFNNYEQISQAQLPDHDYIIM